MFVWIIMSKTEQGVKKVKLKIECPVIDEKMLEFQPSDSVSIHKIEYLVLSGW